MATVVLEVEMHCHGCINKIRRTLGNTHGVQRAWLYPNRGRGTVVVMGVADVSTLKDRIFRAVGRWPHLVSRSDGAAAWGYLPHYDLGAPPHCYCPYAGAGNQHHYYSVPPHYEGITHLAAPPHYPYAGAGNQHHYYSAPPPPPPPYAYQYHHDTNHYPGETSACCQM